MAKATEDQKKKKGGDDQEMIEKPREPMFSKTGMIVMIGSNIAIAILIAVIVLIMSSGGGEEGEMEETKTSGIFNPENDSWLEIPGISTPVPTAGGKSATVRYTILIRFEGGQTEQADLISKWTTGKNDKILRRIAESVMRKYTINSVRDESFARTYETEVKKQLNLKITGSKVDQVVIMGLRFD